MDALALLLRTALGHVIDEPNAEAACERFQSITGWQISDQAFHEAVAAAVHDKLIRDPIRLPPGALQCHWRLELTADGISTAHPGASP